MGTGKDVVDSSAFGKNAQKSPEALHFRGFSPIRPAGVEPVAFRVGALLPEDWNPLRHKGLRILVPLEKAI